MVTCAIFNRMPVNPRDAAAVILLKDQDDPKVFWVKRNISLAFMGGYRAFPGGQLDRKDAEVPVLDCEPGEAATMRVCAVREFFEETGVLIARRAERLSREQLAALRASLESGNSAFGEILVRAGLELSASLLTPSGRWVTPPFAPRRFDTWFFLAWLPDGQEPHIEDGELEFGEWIRPADALAKWERGEALMAPPILHALRTLAGYSGRIEEAAKAMAAAPEARRGEVRRIEFAPGVFYFPVRTPTLPPATHTNCYVVGGEELIVIDPASPYADEQQALDECLDLLLADGRGIREIILTHHHSDHVGGVMHLSGRLDVPVAAHELTARRLRGSVRVDRCIEDGELIEIDGDPGWRLRALHTPGHTRGHLCFYEENTGSVLTGDLVVGLGTVVIDPPEGNMLQYFNSLERLLSLPRLTSLFGAHGPPIASARHKIAEYITHRKMREERILEAVRSGAATLAEIVPVAYTDVSPSLHSLAERSTIAHLEKLEEEGAVIKNDGGRYRSR